jgi:hypothetical protein
MTSLLSIQSVIEIWSMHLDEYLKQSLKNGTKFIIVYDGVQTLLHVFAILYCRIYDLEDYYNQTQRAYLLYLEYVEKIYKPRSMSFSSVLPAVFVYKRIFESDDISNNTTSPSLSSLSASSQTSSLDMFLQIRYWTNMFFISKTVPDPEIVREFLPKLILLKISSESKKAQLEQILKKTPLTKKILEDFLKEY